MYFAILLWKMHFAILLWNLHYMFSWILLSKGTETIDVGLCEYQKLLIRLSSDNSTTGTVNYIQADVLSISPTTGLKERTTKASTCPPNMVYKNCTCHGTCQDPNGCNKPCHDHAECVCAEGLLMDKEDCKPIEQCGCFLDGVGVLLDGDTYKDPLCSKMCHCSNDVLSCEDYNCSPNATCEEDGDGGQCVCNQYFIGDGLTCRPFWDCLDWYNDGYHSNGDFYNVTPLDWPGEEFNVYCDMSHGGGWTVIQRREDGSVNFERNWVDYRNGFGVLGHEFWLGNEKIYFLAKQGKYTIRFDAVDKDGTSFYEEYDLFRIAHEGSNYLLISLGDMTGNTLEAGLNFLYNVGANFSTFDRDNDVNEFSNCAEERKSGWWHLHCTNINPNGVYSGGLYHGIFYLSMLPNAVDIPFIEMKLRPSQI